ncbi:hypothetical protein MNBD_ALPHA06-301 [hydrothermal vent metagenome]|uniref:Uncharacterized protein n=1 Tax=hydrothermal vent metagenome TaxID=652676 RepID=A0A3B0RNP9_9ZZZZ
MMYFDDCLSIDHEVVISLQQMQFCFSCLDR